MATKLTKGERDFLRAAYAGEAKMFHRLVIERCEQAGLARFLEGFRLVGCNSFAARRFTPTAAGLLALASTSRAA